MISSDKNVETIGQLVEVIRHYIGLQKEYLKLDSIDKIVRLFTATAIMLAAILISLFVVIFLSFAAAFFLADKVGTVAAFCIVAAFYLFIFLLFVIFRKALIVKPLVRFLTSLLLE